MCNIIRPSQAPLWRLNLFPVQYVWLSYPRLNSIPFLTFESFLFISHDSTYSVCLCSPALSSLHERSLCPAALPSLDWWGWFFYFIIPLPWLSGGVKPVKDQNFTLFLVNCRARLYCLEMSRAQSMPPDANPQIKCLKLKRWSKPPFRRVWLLFDFV